MIIKTKEMMLLELGCIPFRVIVRERSLHFLYSILNEDPNSLIYRFFQTQMKNPNKRDWTTTVLDDLESLGLSNKSTAELKSMIFKLRSRTTTVWRDISFHL